MERAEGLKLSSMLWGTAIHLASVLTLRVRASGLVIEWQGLLWSSCLGRGLKMATYLI